MSFRPSPADRPPPTGRAPLRLPRWPRYLVPIIAGLIALGVLVTIIAGVWTDFLWYRSVGYSSVFGTVYGTRRDAPATERMSRQAAWYGAHLDDRPL